MEQPTQPERPPAPVQLPSIGRIVHYQLSADDAQQINRRRTTGKSIAERMRAQPVPLWPTGTQAHIGNEVHEGGVYPMLIVAIWSADCVNGQVFLDGNDVYWALSRGQGQQPGQWIWPPRV